jgi:hypothetical protein
LALNHWSVSAHLPIWSRPRGTDDPRSVCPVLGPRESSGGRQGASWLIAMDGIRVGWWRISFCEMPDFALRM